MYSTMADCAWPLGTMPEVSMARLNAMRMVLACSEFRKCGTGAPSASGSTIVPAELILLLTALTVQNSTVCT